MDPNQKLKDLRDAVSNYNRFEREHDSAGMMCMADYIVQYVEALDSWLSAGGLWPSDWKKGSPLCQKPR